MARERTIRSGPPPRWPRRLQLLARQVVGAGSKTCRTERGEIWQVLRTALTGYVRHHAGQRGNLSVADVADISTQKALDLLLRIDTLQWRPDIEDEGQVRAFLSTVARNGVVDVLRTQGRVTQFADPEEVAMKDVKAHLNSAATGWPNDTVEAGEFVTCLHECVSGLTPRARKLWFFRVLYEMPSKGIASHPDIQMSVGHVDVALQRCRGAITACMTDKGMKLSVLPPGTFAALWELCVRGRQTLLKEEGRG